MDSIKKKGLKVIKQNQSAARWKKRLLGTYERMGLLPKTFLYVMLISVCFIYIFPFLSMGVMSFETLDDLLDASVKWLPHSLHLENYRKAMAAMDFWPRLLDTLRMTVIPSLGQMISCALAGYGLARFRFKGKKVMMGIVLLSFVVPFQTTMIPTYIQYNDYGILGTNWVLVLPAIFGQGLRAAIFILICKAFYEQTPPSLDEAACVDGAGEFRAYFTIGLPLGLPAMLTTFLFSFVWYWNETYMTNLYIGNAITQNQRKFLSLTMALAKFDSSYSEYARGTYGAASASSANAANEAIVMAGIILVILVPLIVYFCLQRYFVESIDRSGITGE